MGSYLLVDLHIEVDGHLTVSSAHQIAERARLRIIQSLPTVTEVLVHVDPEPDPPSRMPDEETQLMRPQDEIEQDIVSVLEQVPQVRKIRISIVIIFIESCSYTFMLKWRKI